MSSGIWAAASGAVGQVAHLDNASNNLANVETPGFQVDRMVFRHALEGSTRGVRAAPSLDYAVARSVSPDLRAGRVVPTGRELDVAIVDDNAFFAVETDYGIRYTRAGNLQVMPDGVLGTPQGLPYLGQNHRPIVLLPGTSQVSIEPTGELKVDGELSGQRLLVVQFEDPNALVKEGNVTLFAPREAGAPELIATPYLQSHALEYATDRAFSHMSQVIHATRNFSMMTQVIEAFKTVEDSAARDIIGK